MKIDEKFGAIGVIWSLGLIIMIHAFRFVE
jgi:hypothetical protein